jgi:serine/threonine-protein kinase RsbT
MTLHDDALERQVVSTLSPFMSPMNARTLYQRARRGSGGADDLSDIVVRMRSGVRLFVRPENVSRAESALDLLARPARRLESVKVELTSEADIHGARTAVRDACAALGARPLATQKLLTVVSELARNVVMYTPGGQIEIVPSSERPANITLLCTDRGRGIPHLDEVMTGRYRSRTGLGKGLAGVKRLMDTFEIETGPAGTRIFARASLEAGALS